MVFFIVLLAYAVLSTTFVLVNPDNETLDDTYVYNYEAPGTGHATDTSVRSTWNTSAYGSTQPIVAAWFKFNISPVAGMTVESAVLELYLSSNYLDTGESVNVDARHVYSSTVWTEESITNSNEPYSDTYINYTIQDTVLISTGDSTGYKSLNITDMVKRDVDEGSENTSIQVAGSIASGSPSYSTDYLNWRAKEYEFVAYRPKLTIVASEGGGGDSSAPNYSGVNSNTSEIWNGETIQFNITWSDDTALSTLVFSWNDSGSWQNVTNLTVSGTDYTGIFNQTSSATNGSIVGYRFYANDSSGNTNQTDIYTFNVSDPALTIQWINPTTDINHSQNQTRNYTVQVCCLNNDCGNINVSLDPPTETVAQVSEVLVAPSADSNLPIFKQGRQVCRTSNGDVYTGLRNSTGSDAMILSKSTTNGSVGSWTHKVVSASSGEIRNTMDCEGEDVMMLWWDGSSPHDITVINTTDGTTITTESITISSTDTSYMWAELWLMPNDVSYIWVQNTTSQGCLYRTTTRNGNWNQQSCITGMGDLQMTPSGTSFARLVVSGSGDASDDVFIFTRNDSTGRPIIMYNSTDAGSNFNSGTVIYSTTPYYVNGDSFYWVVNGSDIYGVGTDFFVGASDAERCMWHSPDLGVSWDAADCDNDTICDAGMVDSAISADSWGVYYTVDCEDTSNNHLLQIYPWNGTWQTEINVSVLTAEPDQYYMPHPAKEVWQDHVDFVTVELDDYNATYFMVNVSQGAGGGASPPAEKTLIPNGTGTPFYTTSGNPQTISLNEDQCSNVTWSVNATGSSGSSYNFYAYTNITRDQSYGANTTNINVTINVTSQAGDSCTYSGSGNWTISDHCNMHNTNYNVCPNNIIITDTGSLNISGTSQLNASMPVFNESDAEEWYRILIYPSTKVLLGGC